MRTLAWIGLIMMILNVIVHLISSFTDNKISDRVVEFTSAIIHGLLLYFFSMYLFR